MDVPRATATLVRQYGGAEDAFPSGLYQMTASGSVSWCGFARAIAALGERETLRLRGL